MVIELKKNIDNLFVLVYNVRVIFNFVIYVYVHFFIFGTKQPLIPDKVNSCLSNDMCLLINNNLRQFNYICDVG